MVVMVATTTMMIPTPTRTRTLTLTGTPTAETAGTSVDRPSEARGFHLLAASWIAAMLWLASRAPDSYRTLLQEDRAVEWGTVWLFFAAGVLGLSRSLHTRLGDGMVALFCLFVAGEEFSWGQRLLGYFPPEFFLRNNLQQELTVHNLPQSVQRGQC